MNIVRAYGIGLFNTSYKTENDILYMSRKLKTNMFILSCERRRDYWQDKCSKHGRQVNFLSYNELGGRKGKDLKHKFLDKYETKYGKKIVCEYRATDALYDLLDRKCILVVENCSEIKNETICGHIATKYLINLFLDLYHEQGYSCYVTFIHDDNFMDRMLNSYYNISQEDYKTMISYLKLIGISREEENCYTNIKKKYKRIYKSICDACEIIDEYNYNELIQTQSDFGKSKEDIQNRCVNLYKNIILQKIYIRN